MNRLFLTRNQLTGTSILCSSCPVWFTSLPYCNQASFLDAREKRLHSHSPCSRFAAPAPSHRPSRVRDVHKADGARRQRFAVIALRPAFAARWCQARNATDALQDGGSTKTRQSHCAAAGGEMWARRPQRTRTRIDLQRQRREEGTLC